MNRTIFLLVLLPLVLRLFYEWFRCIGTNSTGDYGPAQLAIRVAMLVRGVPLYRDFRNPPYIPMVYGPIVPYLAAALSRLAGGGTMAALVAGHVLTVCSSIGVCALLYALARRFGASKTASLVVVATFLLSPIIQRWGFEFRVDIPELLLELCGLLLFSLGWAYASLGAFVVAFFIKQGRFAGAAAIVLYLYSTGQTKRAIRFGTLWLGTIVGLVTVFSLLVPWYWLNSFVAPSASFYDPFSPATYLGVAALSLPAIAILTTAGVVQRPPSLRLALCFFCTGLLQDSLSSLRWGSSYYYFLTTMAAMTIIAAYELDGFFGWVSRASVWFKPIAVTCTAATLLSGFIIARPLGVISFGELVRFDGKCRCSTDPIWNGSALQQLRDAKGPVLTDTPQLLLVDHTSSVQWIDLMVLNGMRATGTFDDRLLLSDIREHHFAAIALDENLLNRQWRGRPFFWPRLRQAIDENYVLKRSAGPPVILLPRN